MVFPSSGDTPLRSSVWLKNLLFMPLSESNEGQVKILKILPNFNVLYKCNLHCSLIQRDDAWWIFFSKWLRDTPHTTTCLSRLQWEIALTQISSSNKNLHPFLHSGMLCICHGQMSGTPPQSQRVLMHRRKTRGQVVLMHVVVSNVWQNGIWQLKYTTSIYISLVLCGKDPYFSNWMRCAFPSLHLGNWLTTF